MATILPAIGGKVDEATFRQVETTVVRTVDLLLAVEGVLCRPDVDPDQEAALVARRAELVGGAA